MCLKVQSNVFLLIKSFTIIPFFTFFLFFTQTNTIRGKINRFSPRIFFIKKLFFLIFKVILSYFYSPKTIFNKNINLYNYCGKQGFKFNSMAQSLIFHYHLYTSLVRDNAKLDFLYKLRYRLLYLPNLLERKRKFSNPSFFISYL